MVSMDLVEATLEQSWLQSLAVAILQASIKVSILKTDKT